ncbi:nucleotidyltransferase family protein [Erythrobacter sp.]|jgi:CTP:molybdopterin cytidylyltransferase MocA|uniref:nucleotidyltransferase family protein n=1 Tax=Erythrobacter sp. TaxID=1042 RepID=UPI002ECB8EC9|nr:nucleotidyltransferase family protein [Erythrobacter sp.]
MSAGPRIGAALLAAGSSQRFGAADKLAAPFRGDKLGLHTARALPVGMFAEALVIVAAPGHPCEAGWRALGLEPVINPNAAQGMGTSVALAARRALGSELDGLLVALADMPLVPRAHFGALLENWNGPSTLATSAKGEARLPPALFGSEHLRALSGLEGDRGARGLLMQGRVVDCPPEWLVDIDRAQDLVALD